MINIEEASIRAIVFHKVNIQEDKLILSEQICDFLDEDEADTIRKAFLRPFQQEFAKHRFNHDYDIELNALYKLSKGIYNKEGFLEYSQNIASHLKNVSKHPNIKDGDLFVIHWDNIIIDNQYREALGVYKVENKDSFIETFFEGHTRASMSVKKGISPRKLEKGGLIIFDEEPFTVLVIDNNKQGTDYWQNEFLSVIPVKNEYVQTNQIMGIAKQFVTEQLQEEFDVSRAEQIDFLNRSVSYFKSHETFDKDEFAKEVFYDENVIQSFDKYNVTFQSDNEIDVPTQFEISPQAVKKQAKIFKSVLKLDKNFHIYIHGKRDLIEQGVDEYGRKFYKIFYENES